MEYAASRLENQTKERASVLRYLLEYISNRNDKCKFFLSFFDNAGNDDDQDDLGKWQL